jgi:hypothetical protein
MHNEKWLLDIMKNFCNGFYYPIDTIKHIITECHHYINDPTNLSVPLNSNLDIEPNSEYNNEIINFYNETNLYN